MKIILTLTKDEVQTILSDYLVAKGLNIDPKSATFQLPLDPAYDKYDAPQLFDGVTFDIITPE